MSYRTVLLLLLLTHCQTTDSLDNSTTKEVPKAEAVTTLTVRGREIPWIIQTEGKTVPSERYQAKVPEGGGRIEKVFVQEGQTIEAGFALVKFSDEELRLKIELARAEIEEAEAGLNEVKYLRENRERLLEEQKMSREESEGLDERASLYEATIDRARDEVNLLESQIENLQVTSPIAGLITKRDAVEGDDVEEARVLIEVVRIDPLYLSFLVPLEVAASLEKGTAVTVKFPNMNRREVVGEIMMIGAEAGQEEQVEIKLKLPNETLALKAEIRAEIVLPTSLRKKIITLPPETLVKSERSTYVYKVVNGKIKKTAITLEAEGDQSVATRGVEEGDQIVTSDLEELKEGTPVEIQTTHRF